MIIAKSSKYFKYLNSNTYNLIVSKICFDSMPCPTCKQCSLIHHGRYQRSFCSGSYTSKINVLRVICSYCKVSHAVLLHPMVPFSSLSVEVFIDIIFKRNQQYELDRSHFIHYQKKFSNLDNLNYTDICLFQSRNKPLSYFPT